MTFSPMRSSRATFLEQRERSPIESETCLATPWMVKPSIARSLLSIVWLLTNRLAKLTGSEQYDARTHAGRNRSLPRVNCC